MAPSNKKKRGIFSKKKAPYEAIPMDLILNIDFRLVDDYEKNWVLIELLKGDYAGVKYRYNSIGVEDDPAKGEADRLHMKMDFTVIDRKGKSEAELDDHPEFNNIVFNIVYALLQMQDPKGSLDDSGRDDIGELDSE